ncbi:TPA: ATP-dependent helicase, partial [Streptococcus suis]
MVSTQHGVKGEGHRKILFVAEDSRILEINIYEFLNLFANFYEQNIEFNFDAFQEFYYNFNHDIVLLEEKIGKKMSEIKASDRDSHFDE